MNFAAELIDAMEGTGRPGGGAGDVVAVVGKLLARGEARGLADDFLALDDQTGTVEVFDHPFATKQGERVCRAVVDRDKIDESVGLIGGQT